MTKVVCNSLMECSSKEFLRFLKRFTKLLIQLVVAKVNLTPQDLSQTLHSYLLSLINDANLIKITIL